MLATLLFLADNGKEAQPPQGNPLLALLPFVLIFVLFYVLLILPAQRREKKQRALIMSSLKKGDKVLTNAGIIGVVSSLNPNSEEVTLKLEEGKLRVLKGSIAKIYGVEEAAKEQTQEAGKSN
jgi:preprotein translocase subunit YajC